MNVEIAKRSLVLCWRPGSVGNISAVMLSWFRRQMKGSCASHWRDVTDWVQMHRDLESAKLEFRGHWIHKEESVPGRSQAQVLERSQQITKKVMQHVLVGRGTKQMIYQFIWSVWAPWTLVVFTSVRSGAGPRSCPKGSKFVSCDVMCIKLIIIIILVEDAFYIVLNIWIFCWAAPCAGEITGKHWNKPKEE